MNPTSNSHLSISKPNPVLMKTFLSLIIASFLLLANNPVSESPDSGNISFINPLNANAEVLAGFGTRSHPVTKQEHMHSGIDFNVSIGDDVHAASSGTIVFMDRKASYGNLIEIKHEDGFVTRYAHLSEFHEGLYEGAEVEAGQLIALAGNSGTVTGPVLHFELLLNGEAVDPLLYME